jgi:hypothetical protein
MLTAHLLLSRSISTHAFLPQNKKQVSYKESDSEGEDNEEVIFRPNRNNSVRGRASKRRKTSPDSDDEFQGDAEEGGESDDGICFSATRYASR